MQYLLSISMILSTIISSSSAQDTQQPLGLAPDRGEYHIPFALISFTSLMLIITVLIICIGMWNLNPGKDSIIYRMTSQRKKDQ